MRYLLLFSSLMLFAGPVLAEANAGCASFTGSWRGTCVSRAHPTPTARSTEISQTACTHISIDGARYEIGRKYLIELPEAPDDLGTSERDVDDARNDRRLLGMIASSWSRDRTSFSVSRDYREKGNETTEYRIEHGRLVVTERMGSHPPTVCTLDRQPPAAGQPHARQSASPGSRPAH